MEIHFRRIFTRKSSEVPFFEDSAEFSAYIKKTYIDTGKCVVWRNITEDTLHRITESVWISKDVANVAALDVKIVENEIENKDYCTKNNIDFTTEYK